MAGDENDDESWQMKMRRLGAVVMKMMMKASNEDEDDGW